MGACASSSSNEAEEAHQYGKESRAIERQAMFVKMKESMERLGMSSGERKRFHDFVKSIDENGDDHVSRSEFLKVLDLEPKTMANRIFDVMQVKGISQDDDVSLKVVPAQPLHVVEFFVGTFHFSLRSGHALLEDFFKIYSHHHQIDRDTHEDKSVITAEDLNKMILDLKGTVYLEKHQAEIDEWFLGDQCEEGTLDFEMLRETDVGPDFTDIYDDLYKTVHNFRRRLEEKTMVPIFGPSPERWKIRKKELIQTLRDGGFTSFAQSFYAHLKFEGLKKHNSFAEKAFYEGVHVLDHPGHDDSTAKDDFTKHAKRQTKHVRRPTKVSKSRRNSKKSESGRHSRRGSNSSRISETGENEDHGKQDEGQDATDRLPVGDKSVEDGSFKNKTISFTASPGGDGVARDLPGAPAPEPMSPQGFDVQNSGVALASAILTGAFKNTEEAGSDYVTPAAGSFKPRRSKVVPATNEEYMEFVRREKEEKAATEAAEKAAAEAAQEAAPEKSKGHRRRRSRNSSRDGLEAADLDSPGSSGSFQGSRGNRSRTSSRERSPRRSHVSPRREAPPARDSYDSHGRGHSGHESSKRQPVPTTNEEYMAMLASEKEQELEKYQELEKGQKDVSTFDRPTSR